MHNKFRILLMCALRAHNNFHFWKKNFSKIEKTVNTFLIPKKIFPKMNSLMCALRAHINRTHKFIVSRVGLGQCLKRQRQRDK